MQISFNFYTEPASLQLAKITNQELPPPPHSTMLGSAVREWPLPKGVFFFLSVSREIPSRPPPDVNVAHVVLESSQIFFSLVEWLGGAKEIVKGRYGFFLFSAELNPANIISDQSHCHLSVVGGPNQGSPAAPNGQVTRIQKTNASHLELLGRLKRKIPEWNQSQR